MNSDVATEKPPLVFLCQRLPFPPTTGERITSFNFLRHLCSRYTVFVGTFTDDPSDEAHIPALEAMVAGLHVVRINKRFALIRAIPRWLRGEPLSFAVFRHRSLLKWIRHIERTEKPVAIFTHSSNISSYAVDHFSDGRLSEPIRVLHFADVDSAKFDAYADEASGLKKFIFRIESRRVRREEKRLYDKASKVAVISDEEANVLRSTLGLKEAGRDRVVTLPNGVDTELFDRSRYPDSPIMLPGRHLIFTGAMDYPPNIDAVRWFVHNVFKELRKRLPDINFLIVGTRPAEEVLQLGQIQGVVVTGRVESTAAYMAHSQLAVAPLQIARGVQNKVLEAMAMSLPVIVSPGALTGISATPNMHLVLAHTEVDWIDACIDLLNDKSRATQIGTEARKLVCEHYNWQAQFARLDAFLDDA